MKLRNPKNLLQIIQGVDFITNAVQHR